MVWLHGGGYCAGSSVEIPAYNGHNLSNFGDVVIVNLNHRINCLGFMDLSSFGGIKREDGTTEILFSCNYACPDCGFSFPELTPRMFSFNNPFGACPDCLGIGYLMKIDEVKHLKYVFSFH